MIEGALLVTGAQRSGTTLLDKLLGAQAGVSMLSQPFPFLYSDAKRAFLATIDAGDDPYPLGHLFRETRYDAAMFARFLSSWRTTPAAMLSLFDRMRAYSGQYSRFTTSQVEAAVEQISPDADFADVVATLDRELAVNHRARSYGSKETMCEEFVPPLLDRGFNCVIIIRDPRDVVASLNHGRGHDYGGDCKPTLFNVRAWRKSVAIALSSEPHPRFHWCRYEDVVVDPARELGRLGYGATVPDELREADGAAWRGNSSHTDHSGVSPRSIGTYRTVLPSTVAEFIEATCLPELERLGYATTLSREEAIDAIATFHDPYAIRRTGLERDAATPENAAIEIDRLADA